MEKLLMQLAVLTSLVGIQENYGETMYQIADAQGNILFECPIEVKQAHDKLAETIGQHYPELAPVLAADEAADTK